MGIKRPRLLTVVLVALWLLWFDADYIRIWFVSSSSNISSKTPTKSDMALLRCIPPRFLQLPWLGSRDHGQRRLRQIGHMGVVYVLPHVPKDGTVSGSGRFLQALRGIWSGISILSEYPWVSPVRKNFWRVVGIICIGSICSQCCYVEILRWWNNNHSSAITEPG